MTSRPRSRAADLAATLIGTWFGCGFAPQAPGTVGALGALIPAVILIYYCGWQPWWFAVLAVACSLPAMWAAQYLTRKYNTEDPSAVVVDEVVGQWITLAGVATFNWKSLLAAFVLFRLFDIWKPPPVRQAEALPGGVGIVADDLMAGIYGALVLFLAGCFNFY